MGFGASVKKTTVRNTKVIIRWTKNLVMGFMNGKMDGFIKETSKTTTVMAMENYMKEMFVFIVGSGRMESSLIEKNPLEKYRLRPTQAPK